MRKFVVVRARKRDIEDKGFDPYHCYLTDRKPTDRSFPVEQGEKIQHIEPLHLEYEERQVFDAIMGLEKLGSVVGNTPRHVLAECFLRGYLAGKKQRRTSTKSRRG